MGKLLILTGIILILIGFIFEFAGKIPYIGKLPGDIDIQKENFRLYIPLTSSLIMSIIISTIFFIIRWLRS